MNVRTSASPLDPVRLVRQTFVARVEHHPVLDSTNDRAKRCAAEGSPPLPLLVVADRQTAGRGRGANRWWTGEGGLACSLLVDLAAAGIERSQSPVLSLAAALAVVETVAPLLPSHAVGLRWPNDVCADGRKLAGILIEGLAGGLQVVGIGLNANNTMADAPAELRPIATTLRDLAGRPHDPTSILVELLRHLESLLGQLVSDPAGVAARADAVCLQRGLLLALESGGRTVGGRCAGIAPDGALVLDTPEGRQKLYSGVVRSRG